MHTIHTATEFDHMYIYVRCNSILIYIHCTLYLTKINTYICTMCSSKKYQSPQPYRRDWNFLRGRGLSKTKLN